MPKNSGKSKVSKTVLFNANKHVFHCEKSWGTFFYGQPSYMYLTDAYIAVHVVIIMGFTCVIFCLPSTSFIEDIF
jgi:hypothetical protein